jgi:hypothetical protein
MRRIAWMAAVAALVLGCSSARPVVESEPGVYSRTAGTAEDLPEGAKGATDNPNASTAARLGIPPGHLPPAGQCRVWMPGEPPGKQKKYAQGDCARVATRVPVGGWLVYRPGENKKEVVVREYGERAVVRWTRIFDVVTGELLREEPSGR